MDAEVFETFGGITPQAYRDSPPAVQRDAIEAAWAVQAKREIGLANAIRMAVGADAKTYGEWVRSKEALIPRPPPPPVEKEDPRVAALNADPGAIMRAVYRMSK